MQVPLDGANNDPPNRLAAGRSQPGRKDLQGRLHRTGGDEQLGDEVLIALKSLADLVHGRDHVLPKQLGRVGSGLERRVGDCLCLLGVSSENRFIQLRRVGHRTLQETSLQPEKSIS